MMPAPTARGRGAPAAASLRTVAARAAFASLVGLALVAAIAGGLWRAGTHLLPDAAIVARSAGLHAALMLSVFFGSAISIERAVALGRRWAYAAPLLAGASGVLMLSATPGASLLALAAAAVFVAVNVDLLRRERTAAAAIMLIAALCWLAGNAWAAAQPGHPAAIAWWFAFPILTVTAERLELTRFLPRRALSGVLLWPIVAALVGAAAVSALDPRLGGVAFGGALMLLALWLAVFDIARRTVFARGLGRFMALALLAGYAWLGIGGLAWLGTALGCPGRDMALHALGLGFLFSMILGHAPVIVPALTRVKVLFGAWFYAPLALLHVSLACRLFGAIVDPGWRTLGAELNAAALAVFIATLAGSALASRRRDARQGAASAVLGRVPSG